MVTVYNQNCLQKRKWKLNSWQIARFCFWEFVSISTTQFSFTSLLNEVYNRQYGGVRRLYFLWLRICFVLFLIELFSVFLLDSFTGGVSKGSFVLLHCEIRCYVCISTCRHVLCNYHYYHFIDYKNCWRCVMVCHKRAVKVINKRKKKWQGNLSSVIPFNHRLLFFLTGLNSIRIFFPCRIVIIKTSCCFFVLISIISLCMHVLM